MTADEILSAFVAYLVDTRGNAENTATTYADAVRDLRRRLGVEDFSRVTLADLDRYASKLAHAGLSEATRRGRLTALSVFFEFTSSRGLTPANPSKGMVVWKARERRRIDVFTEAEVGRLILEARTAAPVQGPDEPDEFFRLRARVWLLTEARDRAALGLAYMQALRVGEIGALRLADYAVRKNGSFLTIREAKHSAAPVTRRVDPKVDGLVRDYLAELERAGVQHAALFPPFGPTTRDSVAGIGANGFRAVLEKRMAAAGIEAGNRRLSGHALRYSRATHLYARGVPLLEIQAWLRHRSLETTRRYILLGSEAAIAGKANRVAPWGPSAALSSPLGLEPVE